MAAVLQLVLLKVLKLLLNIKLVKTLKGSATRGRQRLYIMTPDGENMAIDR